QAGTAHLAHLGGALGAFLYLKSPLAPSSWGSGWGGQVAARPKRRRAPRDWKVLTGLAKTPEKKEEEERRTTPSRTSRSAEIHETLDDVDRILDKISAGGISSLTAEERQRLEEASKKFRS